MLGLELLRDGASTLSAWMIVLAASRSHASPHEEKTIFCAIYNGEDLSGYVPKILVKLLDGLFTCLRK